MDIKEVGTAQIYMTGMQSDTEYSGIEFAGQKFYGTEIVCR